MSLRYPAERREQDVLAPAEAEHLGVTQDGAPRTLDVRELESHTPLLLGHAQLPAMAAGAVTGAFLLALLAYIIRDGIWIPAGFAPFVTASPAAALVGGMLAGLGVGGLAGAAAGMVIDLRRRVPLAEPHTLYRAEDASEPHARLITGPEPQPALPRESERRRGRRRSA